MILIALGANLPSSFGEPAQTLRKAMDTLSEFPDIAMRAKSRIWLTAPVPVSDQPWYHNAVVAVDTDLSAQNLLRRLHVIENDFGRVRTVQNAPRLLDLDLIAYNDEIIDDGHMVVPHPRMHQRAFVLQPLNDITPDWQHPVSGLTLAALLNNLPEDQQAQPIEG